MGKKLITWYLLLSKRLLKKPSFWAVLLLAPLMTAGMMLAARGDSHVLRIAIYAQPSDDALGGQIVDDLTSLDGIVHYFSCESEQELRRAVSLSQADAGYLLPADMTELLRQYAAKEKSSLPYNGHLIRVVTNEDTVQLQLAREQFYSVLYPHLSRMIAEQFTLEQEEFSDMEEATVRADIDGLYGQLHVEESIFEFSYDGNEAASLDGASYLVSPLRGLLSLFVLLTGLASSLYLLKDKKAGMFNWVRYGYRPVYEWLCILAGTSAGGAAAFLGLLFSGTFTKWHIELLLMVMLVLAVTGFSSILSRLIQNMAVLGTCIPLVILICAVLSPVFASFRGMMPLKHLLPTWFYLNGLHSAAFRWRFLLYLLAANLVYFILSRLPRLSETRR